MENLQRFDLKIFATRGADIQPYDFVRVFQKWIQEHTIPGTLIDVADYSHMHHGPGVILVAHEMNVNMDYADGRLGLLYHRKQPLDGPFQSRIREALHDAFAACHHLERDEIIAGRLRFDPGRIRFIANDRLRAPREDAIVEQLREQLFEALDGLYSDGLTYEPRSSDPRDRIAIEITTSKSFELKSLLGRLDGQQVS